MCCYAVVVENWVFLSCSIDDRTPSCARMEGTQKAYFLGRRWDGRPCACESAVLRWIYSSFAVWGCCMKASLCHRNGRNLSHIRCARALRRGRQEERKTCSPAVVLRTVRTNSSQHRGIFSTGRAKHLSAAVVSLLSLAPPRTHRCATNGKW